MTTGTPQVQLPFSTMLLMISFASVNAVLFTPALPAIARFFMVPEGTAQQTITWFLIGYTFGQLLYGPLASRFGRKPALYMGIGLQIVSSLVCVLAGMTRHFHLLVIGRLLMALGSGVGLKMTFTLVNECYEAQVASQKISYLMLGFAITPGLAVALGGVLNGYFGWMSCFYAGALYGVILLWLVKQLPETATSLNYDALRLEHLLHAYGEQFKNTELIAGGLLMGACTSFIYVFAALAPFIAINLFGLSSSEYGMANILPPIGMIAGSLACVRLINHYPLQKIIQMGIGIATIGVVIMLITLAMHLNVIAGLFIPTIVVYFGLCFILANASTIAMSQATDKAHASAVMSFINMGTATFIVLAIGYFQVTELLLPFIFLLLCVFMIVIYKWFNRT